MNLADFALKILVSPDLDTKLASPEADLADSPTVSDVPSWPARERSLRIVSARVAQVPKLRGWTDLEQRRRILHALANHELQAVELYARALLLFDAAPTDFRRDLLRVVLEEQRHTRFYVRRLEAIGGKFGHYPVSGYFWRKISLLDTPIRFVSVMSLTFENANLDHTLEGQQVALAADDARTAALFARIHRDEIEHVRFGWRWLLRLKRNQQTMWRAYRESLLPPLHPGRASGRDFHPLPRRQAGLDAEFIARLEQAHRKKLELHKTVSHEGA